MEKNPYTQFIKPKDDPALRLRSQQGVALILVMLAMLVLSVLAASIVFTARSETFASYNYKLDTQADYLAKAGIQRAINWLRSNHYSAITEAQASTYYAVTSTGSPYNLYTSNTSQVTCISGCATLNSAVQLIGYNNGTGSTNYPNINDTEAVPRLVTAAFASDLNDATYTNNRITADAATGADSGYFKINMYLLNYQTVNTGINPPYIPTPDETWLITSRAIWTGNSAANATVAVAEEQAIVQPIYTPTWGNALYGFCSVTMNGSAGTCTDAFNSAYGPYGGGNASVLSGGCDSTTAINVISSGAGVGANGGVTLKGGVSVGGNVTIGSNPTLPCGTAGFSGPVADVSGEVVNGPYKPPPPIPTFRAGFPGAAPAYAMGVGTTQTLPPAVVPAWNNVPWPNGVDSPPLAWSAPCMDATCNGSVSHPYEVGAISMTGGGKGGGAPVLSLIGGPDAYHPVYYDIASLSQNSGTIQVSGYVIINVQGNVSIGGTGIGNGATTSIPPEAVQINVAGTSVSLSGNGAVSAVINAPLASVTLGGGGSAGYMVGSIQALNVTAAGGYPVHYDDELGRVGGSLGVNVSTAYSRKKM
ncbi:MAG TPA: hypothetical protein VKV95_03085 [Terriglobia bacterium]|nr:hypothetical protein [Terriglobia bacterium]